MQKQTIPEDLLVHRLDSIDIDLMDRLLIHARTEFGKDSFHEAWEEFWCWPEELEPFDPEAIYGQLFLPFYLYNWFRGDPKNPDAISPESRTIARDFLSARGLSLSDIERLYLEVNIEAPFSFHEILKVDPGRGFVLRDILMGSEETVSDRSAAQDTSVGDIFFAKVVKLDHVSMFSGCGWIVLPPTIKLQLLEFRKQVRKLFPGKTEFLDVRAVHEVSKDLREMFIYYQQALMEPPVLTNTDGEILALHRISYEIPSAEAAFDALKSLSLLESEDDLLESAEFSADGALQKVTMQWMKRGKKSKEGMGDTILGYLEINGNRLLIEVNSGKRAKKIQSEIRKRLGEQAIHKGTVVQSPESMMKEREEQEHSAEAIARKKQEQEELMKDPAVQEQIRKMMKAHWKSWYSERIPALGDLTPLEASKSSEGRELLEALLLEYEQENQRQENPLLRADIPSMRKRLGLPNRDS